MRELLHEYRGGHKFEIEILPAQSEGCKVGIFEDGKICQRLGLFANEAEASKVVVDIKADWQRKTATEGFYINQNGKKHDAGLYDDMLNNPEADHYFAIVSCAEMLEKSPDHPEAWFSPSQVTREEVEEWKKKNRK
jgi:hypothetical protein